jgi:hypothetical protein
MKIDRRRDNTSLEKNSMKGRRASNESTDTKGAQVLYANDSVGVQMIPFDRGTERALESTGIDNVQEFIIDNNTENDTNGGDTDMMAHT